MSATENINCGFSRDALVQILADQERWERLTEDPESHFLHCETCAKRLAELTADFSDWVRLQELRPGCDGPEKLEFDSDSLTRVLLQSVSRNDQQSAMAPPIPGFMFLKQLGSGAGSVVYQAQQEQPRRIVAVKVTRISQSNEKLLTRFREEAATLASLNHPGIVTALELGEYQQWCYLVMPYYELGSLADHLDGTPWNPNHAAAFVKSLAEAVDATHRLGILHRDIKPANVLVSRNSSGGDAWNNTDLPIPDLVPHLADYGIAKSNLSSVDLTQTGDLVGTPCYMAPEQIQGDRSRITPATDTYALGIILYELLTGRPPFKAESVAETLWETLHHSPLRPTQVNHRIPRDLETICMHAISKSPSDRFSSALDFCSEINRFLENRPLTIRPPGGFAKLKLFATRNPAQAGLLATVLLAVVGLLSLWGFFTWKLKRQRDTVQYTANQLTAERELNLANFDSAFLAIQQHMASIQTNPELNRIGSIELRKDLLQQGANFYDDLLSRNEAVSSLPAAYRTREKIRMEQARLYFSLGKLQYIAEQYDESAKTFESALAICRRVLGDPLIPSSGEDAGLPGAILLSLAKAQIQLTLLDEAEIHALAAYDYFQQEAVGRLLSKDYRSWYSAESCLVLVQIALESPNLPTELASMDDGIQFARQLPAVPDFRLTLAKLLLEKHRYLQRFGKTEAATTALDEMKSVCDVIYQVAPDEVRYLETRSLCYQQLAQQAWDASEPIVARQHLSVAMESAQKLSTMRPYPKRLARFQLLQQTALGWER